IPQSTPREHRKAPTFAADRHHISIGKCRGFRNKADHRIDFLKENHYHLRLTACYGLIQQPAI
ncbi:MAG TPA: hypothetical protein VN361_11065, partial [Oxalicibacterium sp.]|nr:hypothetical protein [Oxalicibacterium sp.]